LIIEDIFDSGNTFKCLKEHIELLEPKSLEFAVAFHKKNPRVTFKNFYAKYIGFFIPDFFVIGYGLDYNEKFRELPHLVVINEKGLEDLRQ
jgi:hypoxanthine phosphoribosyltransferase